MSGRWGLIISILIATIIMVGLMVSSTAGTLCQEDMACWNCHTMGNHICGPTKGSK